MPSPACRRVELLSAWPNRWKMRGMCSGAMPSPVSRTTISMWAPTRLQVQARPGRPSA